MKFCKSVVLAALSALPYAKGKYSYDNALGNGPEDWANVDTSPAENQCGGTNQSGIDVLTGPCDEEGADYIFMPGDCTVHDLSYTLFPHAIQADFPGEEICAPPKMKIPGVDDTWKALQFHIHTGSDHAIDGTYYGADFHLVHQSESGNGFTVLGLFLEPTSPENILLFDDFLVEFDKVEKSVKQQCKKSKKSGRFLEESLLRGRKLVAEPFDIYSLIPEGSTFYYYEKGSLTTPPCSEVVQWNVVDKPVRLTIREYLRMTKLILDYVDPDTCEKASVASPSGYTGRPVQPINGRTITRKCPTVTP